VSPRVDEMVMYRVHRRWWPAVVKRTRTDPGERVPAFSCRGLLPDDDAVDLVVHTPSGDGWRYAVRKGKGPGQWMWPLELVR
jgi:hypothetical protein